MDSIIVGIIVTVAVLFTIKKFIKIYKTEGECNCSSGCACPSKEVCNLKPLIVNKNKQ